MPETTIYHGTIYLADTTTGDEANVAIQIACDGDRLTYTLRSLVCDGHGAIIETVTDPAACQLAHRLLATMMRVSVPAG